MSDHSEQFNECINRLKEGWSVERCAQAYPEIKDLKPLLEIAKIAASLKSQPIQLDRNAVWTKIVGKLKSPRQTENALSNPFVHLKTLRFAFSRSFLAVIMLLVAVSTLNTTAQAAQNSIPGETLYPLKRTVEKIQLSLALDQASRAEVRLNHAEQRLTEAKALVEKSSTEQDPEKNKDAAKAVETTISELVDNTTKAANESAANANKDLLKKVVELTDKQEKELSKMESQVGGDTKKAVTSALDNAVEMNTEATKNLAELENPTTVAGGQNASSTPQDIQGSASNASGTPAILDKDGETPEDNSTSTSPGIKKFGDPNATTTDPVLPEQEANFLNTTTIEIIEIK